MECTERDGKGGHSHPIVKFGTKEWAGYWTIASIGLGILVTLGTLIIKYEHRATITEETAAAAKATAEGVSTRLSRIDKKIDESTRKLDAKMEVINDQIGAGNVEQGKLGSQIKAVDQRLQRIERNQDAAFNRLRPN